MTKKLHRLLICSLVNSSSSKFRFCIWVADRKLTGNRRNPVVLAAADKAFIAICHALEAETIQGQTLQNVTNAAKVLVQATGINADALLSTLQPETQQTVRAYFS